MTAKRPEGCLHGGREREASMSLPRCDTGIHFSLRVIGRGETLHSWRKCKRLAVVSVVSPGSRYHRAPLCRQHWRRLCEGFQGPADLRALGAKTPPGGRGTS